MTSHLDSHGRTDSRPEVLSVAQTGNGIQNVEYDIQALRMCTHTEKTTFKGKGKRSNSSKKMPMPELHTVPALSRLCGIFSMSINLAQYVVLSVHPPVCPHVPVSFKKIYAKGNIPN